MGCQKHFLNFAWEHHDWHPHVSASEVLTIEETNIWGRVVDEHYVRCDKQNVCEICGRTGAQSSCFCDTAVAARCRLRNAWAAGSHRA